MDMDISTSNKRANSYFRFMKNWDNDSKKDLIIKLTESIDNEPKKNTTFLRVLVPGLMTGQPMKL